MKIADLVAEIDVEISRLQEACALLSGIESSSASKTRTTSAGVRAKTSQRLLSPEARDRIRQAQIKRWAKARKAARDG